jgi:hypothetical protein
MIHNIIEVDGVEYQAVAGRFNRCVGCAGNSSDALCGELRACGKHFRVDGETVIFKRRINIKELQNAN